MIEPLLDVLRHAGEVFWVCDAVSRRMLHVSQSIARIWGRTVEAVIARFDAWLDGIHPEDRGRVEMSISAAAKGVVSVETFRVLRPDKSVRWVRARNFPIKVSEEAVCAAGIAEDVTEQHETEHRVHLLQAAIDSTQDGILVLDSEQRVVFNNAVAARHHGRCDLRGAKVDDVLPPEVARRAKEEDRSVIETGQPIAKELDLGFSGHPLVVAVTKSPVYDRGRIIGLVAVGRDVTEVNRIQERLRASEVRFRSFFENAAVGAAMIDRTGRFTSVNDIYCAITGYSREELVGRLGPLDLDHPDEVELDRARLARFFSGEAPFFDCEKRVVRKDGKIVWVRVCVSAIRNAQGEIETTAAIIEDISERKRIEERLRESEERLRLATEAAGIGTFSVDVDNEVAHYSPQLAALLGFPGATDVPIADAFARVHRDDVMGVRSEYMAALRPDADGRLQMEMRFVRPGGDVRWMWFNGTVTFLGEGAQRVPFQINGACRDITDRKRTELALRESEERQAFLLELGDRMRAQAEAHAVIEVATRMLGERLGASRIVFAEINDAEGVANIRQGWAAEGAVPHPVQLRIADFGGPLLDELRAGRTVRYDDVGEPPYVRPDLAALAAIGIRSGLSVPLVIAGRFVLNLNVHQSRPRVWTDSEVSLVEEVAERVWGAIERARTETALRESEERLRLAQSAAGIGIWDWDLRTNRTRFNDEYYALYGLPSGVEHGYEEFLTLVHPDDRDHVNHIMEMTLAGPKLYECEYRALRASDGAERWLAAKGRAEFVDGKPVRVLGIVRDVTARKHVELRLRESEAFLRDVLDSLPQHACVLDEKGIIRAVNEPWERFGRANGGLADRAPVGENYLDICRRAAAAGDSTASQVVESLKALLAGHIETFAIEYPWRAQGETRWFALYADRLAARPTGAIVSHLDVSERKLAEDQNRLLMREVNHRAKNLLSLVQAMARQTVAHDPAEFAERFSERIAALASSQDLLVNDRWSGVDLEALVHSQLAHFRDLLGERIVLTGSKVTVGAKAAQTIGMALHELATNAGKYGALSTDTGRVVIAWSLSPGPGGGQFEIDWRESGGPPVQPPTRRGFGTTVIDQMARMTLSADIELAYPPSGAHWHLRCASSRLQER